MGLSKDIENVFLDVMGYDDIEDKWYDLYETNQHLFEPYEEDPIHKLEQEKI